MTTVEITPQYQVPNVSGGRLQPLILEEPAKPEGGLPRMDDRQALEAVSSILFTGGSSIVYLSKPNA